MINPEHFARLRQDPLPKTPEERELIAATPEAKERYFESGGRVHVYPPCTHTNDLPRTFQI